MRVDLERALSDAYRRALKTLRWASAWAPAEEGGYPITRVEMAERRMPTAIRLARVVLTAPVGEQVMPRVAGASYRCACGANVFTRLGDHRWSCNGCHAEYTSS